MTVKDSALFVLCVLVFQSWAAVAYKSTPVECKENEEPTECVNACPSTCSVPYDVTCYFLVCNKGCNCKKGYIRNKANGPCVPRSECGEYCEKYQEYTSNGSNCPDTCNIKSKCSNHSVEGCYCKEGYILDFHGGQCVLEKDCPKSDN